MSTLQSLRSQVVSIRAKVGKPGDPKHWIFCMAVGSEIPACVASQMGPYDTSFVERMMPEYFNAMVGEDEPGSCCVMTTRGNFIVSMETGEWTKVINNVRGSRRS
jgi:hypothetical protein